MRGKREEERVVVFNGITYRKPPSYAYYYNRRPKNSLHRAVWTHHNGTIPDGFHIHHIDEDTENNDITNLMCVSNSDHRKIHSPRESPLEKTCPHCGRTFLCVPERRARAADGYHGKRSTFCSIKCSKQCLPERSFVCVQCGNEFSTTGCIKVVRFCSAACQGKHEYLHRPGYDKVCAGCGTLFKGKHKVSKYCTSKCAALHRVSTRAGV